MIDGDYRLTPAYDLMNTALHVRDQDFALNGGLSPNMPRSDIYLRIGHPCRQDFEWFGHECGIVDTRVQRILDKYMTIPLKTIYLVSHSHLTEKLQRSYLRIINERTQRLVRR